MAVLKIYIENGFDVVPHCKHFQPSAGLLATANKGRTHLKFPVERPVQRAFDLDWENSWVGTTRICLSFTPAPPPFSKMLPETAKSSSVPGNQHPSWIINHSKGSHWRTTKFSRDWTFLFWSTVATFSGLSFLVFLCREASVLTKMVFSPLFLLSQCSLAAEFINPCLKALR